MLKSELIQALTERQPHMSQRDVELAVGLVHERIVSELAQGGRVEIRGFGSFSVNYRPARRGRNPKTGAAVDVRARYVPHFKPGKALAQDADDKSQ